MAESLMRESVRATGRYRQALRRADDETRKQNEGRSTGITLTAKANDEALGNEGGGGKAGDGLTINVQV